MLRLCLLILCSFSVAANAEEAVLKRATPESTGVPSEAIRQLIETADQKINTMHSVMIVRQQKVIAEAWWAPQTPETKHVMFSLSKSFTSTAMGLVIEEGKVKLDDPVLKFFPDEAPKEPSANLKVMTVKDLLTMSTGHEQEPKVSASTDSWVKTFLAHPVPHKPGTKFLYNTPATYMCSAIVQKVTGKTVLEYLKPKLFDPLGIKEPTWGTSPQGITLGGYGLFIRTEDIAKFGQLYLQQGKWNGQQLVPAAWVKQATSKVVENAKDANKDKSDWQQGYGFQFWQCRHGAYRGDGAAGQFCIVLPEQETVIAITADTNNMQAQLNVIWETLLPALQAKPLPENPGELAKLKETISKLKAKEKPAKK